ncbi:Splicing factor 3A subunit 2-like 2 [Homarus americanus]|uniref:Splicing factor 3A subunit 2-like 2 n=1 Tax=Homarus americanus TaxID=6706 RepID=A0A8J5N3N7_HOMAM|nr:Splicing factor 3A subunit 2-like 2 [Homarus americanus]
MRTFLTATVTMTVSVLVVHCLHLLDDPSPILDDHLDKGDNSDIHPDKTNKTEVHPDKTEVHPNKTEVHPNKTEVHPDKTEVHPNKTEVHPNKTEVHPDKTEVHPNKTEVHPNKTEVHPNKTEVHPNKTEVHPNKTELRFLMDLRHQQQYLTTTTQEKAPSKSRKRRATFYWPSGSKFVAEFYFTIPISAPTGVTIPLTLDVPYKFVLPNITTDDDMYGRDYKRQSDRLDVYGIIEGLLNRFGMDGKSCMLRAVCERAQTNLVSAGMLGEVITTILMASSASSSEEMYEYVTAEYYGSTYGNCPSMYSGCPMSFFNWLE